MILVTGASGRLGGVTLQRLRVAGQPVRALSRNPEPAEPDWVRGDLATGAGLAAALDGVSTVVPCATTNGRGDITATRRLIEAARRAGGVHLVFVSIVGTDRIPLPYYRAKHETELLIEESGLDWTMLRATQFHQLLDWLFSAQRRLPMLLSARGIRVQPVDVYDVAERLVELCARGPLGWTPELGGPRTLSLREFAKRYLEATGSRRRVVDLPVPGKIARAYRAGYNLSPDRADGHIEFTEFLADRYGR